MLAFCIYLYYHMFSVIYYFLQLFLLNLFECQFFCLFSEVLFENLTRSFPFRLFLKVALSNLHFTKYSDFLCIFQLLSGCKYFVLSKRSDSIELGTIELTGFCFTSYGCFLAVVLLSNINSSNYIYIYLSIYLSMEQNMHVFVLHGYFQITFISTFSSQLPFPQPSLFGFIGIFIHKYYLVLSRALYQRSKDQALIFSPGFVEPLFIQWNRNSLFFRLQSHQNHMETLINTSFQDSLAPDTLIQQI